MVINPLSVQGQSYFSCGFIMKRSSCEIAHLKSPFRFIFLQLKHVVDELADQQVAQRYCGQRDNEYMELY